MPTFPLSSPTFAGGCGTLEFCILTATRSSETMQTCWQEFDLDAKIWSKADGRIEPDALRRAAAVVDEQRIKEREERVDRVERRTARAPVEEDVDVGNADQVVEHAEIDVTARGVAEAVPLYWSRIVALTRPPSACVWAYS